MLLTLPCVRAYLAWPRCRLCGYDIGKSPDKSRTCDNPKKPHPDVDRDACSAVAVFWREIMVHRLAMHYFNNMDECARHRDSVLHPPQTTTGPSRGLLATAAAVPGTEQQCSRVH